MKIFPDIILQIQMITEICRRIRDGTLHAFGFSVAKRSMKTIDE